MRKKIAIALLLMGSTNFIGHAQFVQNGDFEDRETPNQMSQISNADYWSSGYAGTPDLFDVNGAPVVSMPAQTFVNPRSNGLVNECFAGFWGPTDEASDNEYIQNELLMAIPSTDMYTLSFYVARDLSINNQPQNRQLRARLHSSQNGGASAINITLNVDTPVNNMIPYPTMPGNWMLVSGTFSLTPAQVQTGYDLLEIFPRWDPTNYSPNGSLNKGYFYIDDVSIEKVECPHGLALEVDCETESISITNFPIGATGFHTTWYKSKKLSSSGYGQVHETGTGAILTTVTNGSGYYTVVISYYLPNGQECTQVATIYFNQDDCCDLLGGYSLTGSILDNAVGYYTASPDNYPWSVEVPFICAMPDFIYDFDIDAFCETEYFYSNSIFDEGSWSDVSTIYSNGWVVGQAPNIISLNNSQVAQSLINHLQVYVAQGWTNSLVLDILFIPACSSGGDTKILSVEQSTVRSNVQLFPNPVKDNATVNLGSKISGSIVVIAMDGKVLIDNHFNGQSEVNLNTEELAAGVYIVNINVDDETITKKLIKE